MTKPLIPRPLITKGISSALAGALFPLAFAPFHLTVLGFLALALLLRQWLHNSPAHAAFTGFCFGLGAFGLGISWVYFSLKDYGHAPGLIAFAVTLAFVLALTTTHTLQGYLFAKWRSHNLLFDCLLLFPAGWTLAEWVQSTLFTGFPWELIGYTQMDTPLASFAPIMGLYGLTFLSALISGLGYLIWKWRVEWKLLYPLGGLLAIFGLGLAFKHVNWTIPTGQPLKVSLIQPNIPFSEKWDSRQWNKMFHTYQTLTQQVMNSDIILWPEGSLPTLPQSLQTFLAPLHQQLLAHKSTLIYGTFSQNPAKDFLNAINTLGAGHGEYCKRHLVPFGEYYPWREQLRWLYHWFEIPMNNLVSGAKQQFPIVAGDSRIGGFICYEVAYQSLVIPESRLTDLLVVLTDDSWFGHSLALPQHLQMAQMRAAETGRYLLFDTNDGITGVIDPHGKITASLPPFKEAILTTSITRQTGWTPLQRWPWWPASALVGLIAFMIWRRLR